jgi:hypothetical protein
MATTRKMELTFRGKHAFDSCKSKDDLIQKCRFLISKFKELPEETKIDNNDDDYIFFSVEAKDKDDVKYYKSKGFQ